MIDYIFEDMFSAQISWAARYLGRNPRADHKAVSAAVRGQFYEMHLERDQVRKIVDAAYRVRSDITGGLPIFSDMDGES